MLNDLDHALSQMSVSALSIPLRASTILEENGKHTVLDLLMMTRESLRSIPYIGQGSFDCIMEEVRRVLSDLEQGVTPDQNFCDNSSEHFQRSPDPSPKEIQQLCEETRENWDDTQRRRAGGMASQWIAPTISLGELG